MESIKKQPLLKLLSLLFKQISRKNNILILLVSFVALLSALLETASIALVVPFLEGFFSNQTFNKIDVNNFDIGNDFWEIIIRSPFTFILIVIIASLSRISFYYISSKVTASIGSDLSIKVFKSVFNVPYSILAKNESQKIISGLVVQIDNVTHILDCFSRFFSSLLLALILIVYLSKLSLSATLLSVLIFVTAYSILGFKSRKNLVGLSSQIATKIEDQIKLLNQIYSMRASFIIDQSFEKLREDYSYRDKIHRNLTARTNFLGSYPRPAMEAVSIILIILLFYIFSNKFPSSQALPLLGSYIYATQRLIPSFQQIYAQWISINANTYSLVFALNTLSLNYPKVNYYSRRLIDSLNEIKIKNVSFSYKSNGDNIIEDLNFTFSKGDKISIVGPSGVGKSSLLDLITGLRSPTKGCIEYVFSNNRVFKSLPKEKIKLCLLLICLKILP